MFTLSLTVLDASACFVALVLLGVVLTRWRKRGLHLPPGPSGLPIVGNLLDMRSDHKDWLSFYAWGRQYGTYSFVPSQLPTLTSALCEGDIVSINIFGQTLIILNSPEAAEAMLSQKSHIYSDRPVFQMAGELSGWKNTLVLLRYGDRWRRTRRFFRNVIGSTSAMRKFHPGKEFETQKFLARVLATPDRFRDHTRSLAGAQVLRDTYGIEVANYDDDPFIRIADEATDQFSRASAPPGWLVDFIPAVQYLPEWFPGAQFKAYARTWLDTLNEMVDRPYNFVKEQVATGTALVSFTSMLLEDKDLSSERQYEMKWAAASLYSGASDTTVSAMAAFFQTMSMNSNALKRAQEEIDGFIGSDRLPKFSDRPHLPYVEALMWEVLRWCSIVPTSVPHRLVQDDIHQGYHIPAGSLVLANLWGMTHDERTYSDPMTFRPERFLGDAPEKDPRQICFGFGRRICPGLYFADASLWILCAMSLAVFDISKFVDEKGRVVEPIVDQTPGTISHPVPFKCSIKPRSEKAVALIHAEA